MRRSESDFESLSGSKKRKEPEAELESAAKEVKMPLTAQVAKDSRGDLFKNKYSWLQEASDLDPTIIMMEKSIAKP